MNICEHSQEDLGQFSLALFVLFSFIRIHTAGAHKIQTSIQKKIAPQKVFSLSQHCTQLICPENVVMLTDWKQQRFFHRTRLWLRWEHLPLVYPPCLLNVNVTKDMFEWCQQRNVNLKRYIKSTCTIICAHAHFKTHLFIPLSGSGNT